MKKCYRYVNTMQGGIIDNHTRILADEIAKIAPHCKSIDIGVGYFFFSGFEEIREQIKDIPMRILVGLELDPKLISQLGRQYQDGTSFRPNTIQNYVSATRSEKIQNFLKSSIGQMLFRLEEIYLHRLPDQNIL